MATFQSPGFAHYSLAWSPFLNNTLAVATSANYGLIGNGRLSILSVDRAWLRGSFRKKAVRRSSNAIRDQRGSSPEPDRHRFWGRIAQVVGHHVECSASSPPPLLVSVHKAKVGIFQSKHGRSTRGKCLTWIGLI